MIDFEGGHTGSFIRLSRGSARRNMMDSIRSINFRRLNRSRFDLFPWESQITLMTQRALKLVTPELPFP